MSSFANQAGQLRASLVSAGLPAAAATIIANILGNSVQTMRQSGEIIQDSTPQGLRQVTPDDRTHRLTNIDFRESDPDYRKLRTSASEQRLPPVQQNTVVGSLSPQQTDSAFRVKGGSFINVQPAGDTASVGLRIVGPGDCVFRDLANDTLVARSLRAESDASDRSRLRFFIEPRSDEVVFRLSTVNTASIPVVTDVSLTAEGIVVQRKTVQAWVAGDLPPTVIPVGPCPS
jgi:hypothetical protein